MIYTTSLLEIGSYWFHAFCKRTGSGFFDHTRCAQLNCITAQGGNSPGNQGIQRKVRGKYFDGKVRGFHEKQSNQGKIK